MIIQGLHGGVVMNTVSLLDKTGLQNNEGINQSVSDLSPEGREISMEELAKRREFVSFDNEAAEILKKSKPVLMAALPAVLDEFYKKVFAEPEVAGFFATEAAAQGAKSQQNEHWGRITDGVLGEDYLQAALRIGRVHEQIGLEPHWYISSYGLIMEGLIRALLEQDWPKARFGRKGAGAKAAADKIGAFIHAALLDMQITISAYISTVDSHVRRRDERQKQMMDEAIATMSAAVGQLAQGDLTCQIGDGFPEAYAALQVNFNGALEKLTATMYDLHGNADGVSSAIQDISAVAEDMSRRTEGQAASLEESTTALSDLAGGVRQTSAGITQVSAAVKAANAGAADASRVVGEAGEAMQQINDSSRKISNIIGLIDEIAFQTNLLALNAGVEAARAGDAGRGFAVVATEVRALAQRSADAAKEIKALIQQSGQQVARGVDLVQRSGKALGLVTTNVAQINDLASGISETSRNQSSGLEQVSEALRSMSGEVQKNAAVSEQATSSIISLRNQIELLSASLNMFKV